MIRHQIKTIEQAAELYRELVGKTSNMNLNQVTVSDYKIKFTAGHPDVWCVNITVKWGAETDTGCTTIDADVYCHWNHGSVNLCGFKCNRETILEMLGQLPDKPSTIED